MVPRGLLHSDGWKLKIADIPRAKQVCEVRMGLKKGTCFFSPKTTLKNGKAFYMPQVNIFSSAPYVVPFLVRNRARKDVAKICKDLLFCGVMFSNTWRVQHLAYAPLSRHMPANTSAAFDLWCSVFQHFAYASLSHFARQYFNIFCVCFVVLCCPTLGVRSPVPRYARHNMNCMNRPGKSCRAQS